MKFILSITVCFSLCLGAMADTVSDLRPVINEAAAQHGLDPVLIEAIIRLESGHATSVAARKKNNLAGIMGRRGQRTYESKEHCVHDLARILGNYKAKGRVTVAQIGRIYCTSSSGWIRGVNSNMARIRAGKWGDL